MRRMRKIPKLVAIAHVILLMKDLKSGCHSAKGRRRMVVCGPKPRRLSYLKGIKRQWLHVWQPDRSFRLLSRSWNGFQTDGSKVSTHRFTSNRINILCRFNWFFYYRNRSKSFPSIFSHEPVHVSLFVDLWEPMLVIGQIRNRHNKLTMLVNAK